jgi:iron complex outermembrane receptor protein
MKHILFGLLAGTVLTPAAALAQADPANGASATPADIVVTAQRYEQRLIEVPISITAVTADEIRARAVTSLKDMQYAIPGLSSFEYGPGQQFLQLQGVSTTPGSPTVGIYFDETPTTLNAGGQGMAIQLLDLERVEVLRGPQATLYGEGSMGGTIRYIPAAPRLDVLSGSIQGDYNSVRGGEAGGRAIGVVNLPIVTDKLAARVVVGYERTGGWIENSATGQKDVNGDDLWTIRGTLLARPTDRLTLSVMALYQSLSQGYQNFGVNGATSARVPTYNRDHYTLLEGKLVYDLGFADLTGIGSYLTRKQQLQTDISAYYLPYLGLFGIPPGFITSIGYAGANDTKAYSGEVRLSSQRNGPFTWMVGASYRDLQLGSVYVTNTAPGTLPFALLAASLPTRSKVFTAYGEAGYQILDGLKATAGLRYYDQKLDQTYNVTSFGAPTVDLGNGKFHSVNPRFNLSYEISRSSIVYANVAKGFRGGGINTSTGGGLAPATYQPDHIWTYEAGTKHQLFGNVLTIEGSVYHSLWSDVQSYGILPTGLTFITNSGHVKGWGLDLAASVRPAKGLAFSGTYGWNNLKFDKATGDKLVGDPVDLAVRKSYSAAADYRRPLTETVTGFLHADYQHSGPAQSTLRNLPTNQITRFPGRNLVGMRVGVDIGKLEVAVYATNLTNEKAPIFFGPLGAVGENVEQQPRVIGVSGRFAF